MSPDEHHGTVAVLLPDDWTSIPLEDDVERTAAVDDVIERQLGRSRDLAGLRKTMHRELLRATELSARGGGVLMALATGSGGTPAAPASLTVYRVPGSLHGRGGEAMTSVLASDEPGHSLDVGDGPAGTVLRRVRPSSGRTGLTGERDLPALLVDYWVEPTPGARLVYLVFSSPLVDLRDELLGLFDAVVSSVRVLTPADHETRAGTNQEDT